MSTRAVYTFIDSESSHSVYKHHDGYPSGAAQWIAAALPLAWPLPRFEADEFAAAFVAANKPAVGAGGIRLSTGPDAHGDLAYAYEIQFEQGALCVRAKQRFQGDVWIEIFAGPLAAFTAFAAESPEA